MKREWGCNTYKKFKKLEQITTNQPLSSAIDTHNQTIFSEKAVILAQGRETNSHDCIKSNLFEKILSKGACWNRSSAI